ncbi:DUF2486 family protein [Paraburkholderia sp. HD33-4]|uniref:DUF2486 family protein n=1 Tax=Paraburkholderia sp. HD33-4 TaxID=2883242 RepID=UPI001F3ABF05|nr:DUF2486 family protein [Paraburkholderia sp. HD33-4]
MSDPHDNSIPILNEVLVPGRTRETREASDEAAAPTPQPGAEPATPSTAQPAAHEPALRSEPAFVSPAAHQADPTLAPEPVLAPQPVPTPEQLSSPEPVLVPEPLPTREAEPAAEHEPLAQAELHQPRVADHTHARRHARPHHGIHARHGRDDLHEDVEVSPGVFDRTEPFIPLEAGATVPPDLGHEGAHEAAAAEPTLDADAIAARLHGRFQSFLTGEGHGIIEARCRDAVQQHTSLLVSQITREVAQTLEAEMTDWVREAVEEEISRRSR